MARIVFWPDRMLNHPTQPVNEFGADLRALLDRMLESMREAEGIGLAANQIGVPLRVALIAPKDGEVIEMVNPRILAKRGEVLLDEGCLSIPGEQEQVKRATEVDVVYRDAKGAEHQLTATERIAHIVQHEVDHLDGVVYVQH